MILIVEDEVLIGLALRMVLRVAGYAVLGPAAAAEEALDLAQRRRPGLAFVDIDIAGARDGVALARELTTRYGTMCIFLTAQVERARQAREVAIGVMGKPYDPPELLQAVRAVAAIQKGELPDRMPHRLELFHRAAAEISSAQEAGPAEASPQRK